MKSDMHRIAINWFTEPVREHLQYPLGLTKENVRTFTWQTNQATPVSTVACFAKTAPLVQTGSVECLQIDL